MSSLWIKKQHGSTLLAGIRAEMTKRNLTALIIPSSDAHNSEYVGLNFQRRAKVSGFKGSAGTAVITQEKALMWTDGRYWIEAETNLWPGWELIKDRPGHPDNMEIEKWLNQMSPSSSTPLVGIDPWCVTDNQWNVYANGKDGAVHKFQVIPTQNPNIVDLAINNLVEAEGQSVIDHKQAPPLEKSIWALPVEFTGESVASKLQSVADVLRQRQCQLTICSALDDVAWLLNLRCKAEVPSNNVFYSYVTLHLSEDKVITNLFVDTEHLSDSAIVGLQEAAVVTHPYKELSVYLKDLAASSASQIKVSVDNSQMSHGLFQLLSAEKYCLQPEKGIVNFMKCIKNDVELEGFRQCHKRDGLAVTMYLAWLNDRMRNYDGKDESGAPITEVTGSQYLRKLREATPLFESLSFETISSTGSNGAIIHYNCSTCEHQTTIEKDAIYLCDSGGHYRDGTTDVTRTICFTDTPPEGAAEAYTCVLQGNIALRKAVFPPGVVGARLDVLARIPLWQRGLDYQHGTGHGVGHCLVVHEGPQGIGVRPMPNQCPLQLNMIMSNEPGYYRLGHYGIRIENLEIVVPAVVAFSGDLENDRASSTQMMGFETITCVPLCRDLIKVELLKPEEREHINAYSAWVSSVLLPQVPKENHKITTEYIQYHTQPI